jgi:hypothetical protein
LVCSASGISPISSRNSVPLSAASKRPTFLSVAPVNAPFSWPNSSLSISVSVSAAQLTATHGPAARRLPRWIARATISLPAPDSPPSSTVASVGATRVDQLEQRPRRRRAADQLAVAQPLLERGLVADQEALGVGGGQRGGDQLARQPAAISSSSPKLPRARSATSTRLADRHRQRRPRAQVDRQRAPAIEDRVDHRVGERQARRRVAGAADRAW